MKIQFFIVMALGFWLTTFSYAQNAVSTPKTIQNYMNALNSKDQKIITLAWKKLSENKEDVEYLKTKMPKIYRAYRLKGLAIRLEEMQVTYFNNIEPPTERDISPKASSDESNQAATRNSPNQEVLSNSEAARSSLNQNATPNNITAEASPNAGRNLTSIQDSIRSRK